MIFKKKLNSKESLEDRKGEQIWGSWFDSRCQFHQHFMYSFFVQKFRLELFGTYILGLNFFLHKNISTNSILKCWGNWP